MFVISPPRDPKSLASLLHLLKNMARVMISSQIPKVPSRTVPLRFLHNSQSTLSINKPTIMLKKPIMTNKLCFFSSRNSSRRRQQTKAAPSSTSAVVPDDIADVLGGVSIFTAAGEPVKLEDLWDQKEGIAVVALLRHFGCFCCWEFAEALKESKERFEAAGVKLIAIGVGTPDKAQMLAQRLPFPMENLYADPDRKAYDVLGLYYGLGRTFFNPASTKVFSRFDAIKKAMKNYTIKATPDDASGVLQQGGMFVFRGKELLYARKEEGTGDHAPLDDVFDICCKVPSAV